MQSNISESDEASFNKQVHVPSHLASKSNFGHISTVPTISCHLQSTQISDDFLQESVRSLNRKQRIAHDSVLSWCRNKVKNAHSLKPEEIKPMCLFITGGAGAGKSHLIKAIYYSFKIFPRF